MRGNPRCSGSENGSGKPDNLNITGHISEYEKTPVLQNLIETIRRPNEECFSIWLAVEYTKNPC